jgi:hypothetical protein
LPPCSGPPGAACDPPVPTVAGALPPSPFSLDHATQSLAAGRAAKPPRRVRMRECEMLFAPGTIAAKKSGFRGWALALARLDGALARRARRRARAGLSYLCSPVFGATRPILSVLGLAFLSTVGGLPILLAGSPSPPASSFCAALRATVSSLGMCGVKGFLAALEQTEPLPRLTCPLTGPRLAASLMWAQGSCELPTAKPRTRRSLPPLRGALLAHPPSWSRRHPNYNLWRWIPSHPAGHQPTANHR